MPFPKGTGAPKGNKNASKNKPWREAIRNVFINDPEKLLQIAMKMADMAEQGDMHAIKEIGDRLDGKAPQAVKAEVSVSEEHRVDAPPRTESYEEWQKRHGLESTTGTTTTRH